MSGFMPLRRSPWLGDSLTSATTQDSGLNCDTNRTICGTTHFVGPAWTVRNTLWRKRRSGAVGICAGNPAGHKLPLGPGLELYGELAKLLQARRTYDERRPEPPKGRSGPPHRRGPAPSHYTDTATPSHDEAISAGWAVSLARVRAMSDRSSTTPPCE